MKPVICAADHARMQSVSDAARQVLKQSGRFIVVDTAATDAQPVKDRALQECKGCEVDLARTLGAEESMLGVVTRVAKTEYYVSIKITDVPTGKVLYDESAFFTGADDAWASGVRMMIKHGVLAAPDRPPP